MWFIITNLRLVHMSILFIIYIWHALWPALTRRKQKLSQLLVVSKHHCAVLGALPTTATINWMVWYTLNILNTNCIMKTKAYVHCFLCEIIIMFLIRWWMRLYNILCVCYFVSARWHGAAAYSKIKTANDCQIVLHRLYKTEIVNCYR